MDQYHMDHIDWTILHDLDMLYQMDHIIQTILFGRDHVIMPIYRIPALHHNQGCDLLHIDLKSSKFALSLI